MSVTSFARTSTVPARAALLGSAVSGYPAGYLAMELWATPATAAIQMIDLAVPRRHELRALAFARTS